MLEKAGIPINKIKARSHSLAGLLKDLGKCTVKVPGIHKLVSASRLRSCELEHSGARITVGQLIDEAEQHTAERPLLSLQTDQEIRGVYSSLFAGMEVKVNLIENMIMHSRVFDGD